MNLDKIISISKSKAKAHIRAEFDSRAIGGGFNYESVFYYPGVSQYIGCLWAYYITNVSRECEETLDSVPFDSKEYGQRIYYLEKVRGGYILYPSNVDTLLTSRFFIKRLPSNIDEVIWAFEKARQDAEQDMENIIAEYMVSLSADNIAHSAVLSQVDDLLKAHNLKLDVSAHPSGKLKCRLNVSGYSMFFPLYFYADMQSVREETRKVIEENMDNIYSPKEDY